MEQMNMNTGTQTPQTPEEKKSVGATVSVIIIVLVLALGGYYFLKQIPTSSDVLTPAETQADSAISSLSTQGTSTDLSDIQKDLDATDLSGLDAGLSDIVI